MFSYHGDNGPESSATIYFEEFHQVAYDIQRLQCLVEFVAECGGTAGRVEVCYLRLRWRMLQLNCCGAVGPQDYKFSEWFNRTRKTEAVFVPPSCCVLRNDDPRSPDVVDENVCQINAIGFLFDNSALNKTQLKTRVRRLRDAAAYSAFWRRLGMC